MITYTIFSPDEINFPLGVIDKKGNVLSGVSACDAIIANAKKGLANNKANNLLCVLNIDQPRREDVITLGKLLRRPSKPKSRKFVSELLERTSCDLPVTTAYESEVVNEPKTPESIKSGNRYKSKVDWSSDRVRNQVQGLLAHGESLSFIANHLGVSRSTLTEANKRHNHRLYIPKKKDKGDEITEP